MNKTLKHIKENSILVDPQSLKSAELLKNGGVFVRVKQDDGVEWHGCLQKIHTDKNGDVVSYEVYIY